MSAAALDPRELAAVLEWYVENGVDIALDDAPHDRYADSERAPAIIPAPVEPPREAPTPPLAPGGSITNPRAERSAPTFVTRREITPVAPDEAARAAAQAAAEARDLADLAAHLASFDYAPFRDMARHFHFAAGAAEAPLMVLDVAPGEAEEASGEPFCGSQARLLDNMLAAIGFDRSRARLGYLSPWRPPGLTNLTPQQIAIFAPFARRHVELARPRMLLLFGEAPMRALIDSTEPMPKLRGRPQGAHCGEYLATAFVFPSLDSMLSSSALKPSAWRDLRAAAKFLSET